MVTAAVIWVLAQGFGGILTGHGTDPNTGPLLIVLAAAFWPLAGASRKPAEASQLAGASAVDPETAGPARGPASQPRPACRPAAQPDCPSPWLLGPADSGAPLSGLSRQFRGLPR
jgi:hypothetical protein